MIELQESKTAHFKISLKQIAIYRIAGNRSDKYVKDLNSEINWRANHLNINREYSQNNSKNN